MREPGVVCRTLTCAADSGLGLEQVADFGEQQFGGGRAGGGFGALEARERLDDPEDGESDNHEIEHGVEEDAEIDGDRTRLLGGGQRIEMGAERFEDEEDIREIDAADEETDDRGDDILDQASDDAGEGGADDDADREIDHVAAHNEGLEFGDPARFFDFDAHDDVPLLFRKFDLDLASGKGGERDSRLRTRKRLLPAGFQGQRP